MEFPTLDIKDGRTPFMKWVDGDGARALPSYAYVASSWRNLLQQAVVGALRSAGVPHYDFRNPRPGGNGFRWFEIDPNWRNWGPTDWRRGLKSKAAWEGFCADKQAMDRADCCVLVLPAGRSAHTEAGYMAAQGKPVFTLALEPVELELMVLLLGPADHICTGMDELFDRLGVGVIDVGTQDRGE
jgi:hypothetical protein